MKKRPNSARRGVMICGAYGRDNAGDDAVLRAVTASMREYDRAMPVTVMSRHAKRTAKRFGVEAVHPVRILRWLWLMGRTKLFLSGGGSLIQDVTSRRSLWYYLFTIWCAKKRGCAVQLYGCGIGPVRHRRDRILSVQVLSGCVDAVTVRDEDSLQLLSDWGVKGPALRLAADPALAFAQPVRERERTAVFALRGWPGFWEKVPCFERAAKYVWEKYGLEPVFVTLGPGDRTAAESVCAELDVPYKIVSDARALGRAGLVVSMRLHGLIFAVNGGAAAAGVSYDPKVEAFCRHMNLAWSKLGGLTEDILCALIDEAAREDAEAISENVQRQRALEKINAATAAELLAR